MNRKTAWFLACTLIAVAISAVPVAGQTANQRDRWAGEMTAFERQDVDRPSPSDAVLFVGSSSIRMWKLPESFPETPTINRGFGGSQIVDSVRHFDLLVAKHRPRVVVFYAGDNDVASGKSAEQVHRDYRDFRERLRRSLPEAKLLYIAIKPSIARWKLADVMQAANQRIAVDCETDKLATFVDVWRPMLGEDGRPREELFVDDGLHLNKDGYKLWAGLLRPHLKLEADDDR